MVYISQRGYGELYPYIRFPRQRGKGLGSIFRGFLRLVKPLVKTGIRVAKPLISKGIKAVQPVVKRQMKRGLTQGVDMIADSTKDFINEQIKTSKQPPKKKRKVNKKASRSARGNVFA